MGNNAMALIKRRLTSQVRVGNIIIGSDHPVVIQSMTNTPTTNINATIKQIKQLISAGSELIRLTVNNDKAAEAVIEIHKRLCADNINISLIGDFHFNGHDLLSRFPEMAHVLAKYRVNPGNLGRGRHHDERFEAIIKIAIKNQKPIRIGVNGGSLDPAILKKLMDENGKSASPQSPQLVFCDAMVESALQSAKFAETVGLTPDKIILSAKTSAVEDLIYIYQQLAQKCVYPLHLGLTEAGSEDQGIVSSAIGVGILLQQGIGDTIRVSLTSNRSNRSHEITVCKHILQALDLRHFQPKVISCPGCGRTMSNYFQQLEITVKKYIAKRMPEWRIKYPNVVKLKIAVMGCVVNGPGESKHADIGISLPGINEEPNAVVYIKGNRAQTLRGKTIDRQFLQILERFIQENCYLKEKT